MRSTKVMDKRGLTAEDICSIINTCALANVRSINFDGLHLEFGVDSQASKSPPLHVSELNEPTEAALSEKEHEELTNTSLLQDETRLRMDQIDLMLIEDPLKAEKLIADGELDDTGANERGAED